MSYDKINPPHYQGFSNGAQVIDITENLSFNAGNAVKYLARAGRKSDAETLTDLRKAKWYVEREIERVGRGQVVDEDGKPAGPLAAAVAANIAEIEAMRGGFSRRQAKTLGVAQHDGVWKDRDGCHYRWHEDAWQFRVGGAWRPLFNLNRLHEHGPYTAVSA